MIGSSVLAGNSIALVRLAVFKVAESYQVLTRFENQDSQACARMNRTIYQTVDGAKMEVSGNLLVMTIGLESILILQEHVARFSTGSIYM